MWRGGCRFGGQGHSGACVLSAQGRIRSERHARHRHDLAAIADSQYFPAAIEDRGAAAPVIAHKSFFFIEKLPSVGTTPRAPRESSRVSRSDSRPAMIQEACDCDSSHSEAAPENRPIAQPACRASGRIPLSCVPTVFCLLPRRPLVRGGTRRDGLTSHVRLKNGRFEPSNPSVDVFQGIGIHR
jgi:hypothetical protein